MSTFIESLKTLTVNQLGETARERWKEYLLFEESDKETSVISLQGKFFLLLEQKLQDGLQEQVERLVNEEFENWYDDEPFDSPVQLQSVDLDGLESGVWQLLYEDDSEEPIVHVYFKGWEIDYLAVTG